jgi:uncharacterized protein (DUF1800 family)
MITTHLVRHFATEPQAIVVSWGNTTQKEALMSNRDAAIALRRFGLGARAGEIERIASDPRGFVLQSLTQATAHITYPDLEPSHVTFATAMIAQRQKQQAEAMRLADAAKAPAANELPPLPEQQAPPAEPTPDMPQAQAQATPTPALKPGRIRREAFLQEAFARFNHASTTDAAFLERLVMFWSNHFCVSANKGPVRGIAGAYEREAIRPHVLGRFTDMLIAVEQHPAMLIYLDNAQSIGPGSKAGLNRGRGLNENLAREILELHTLGVGGGYTQDDVLNLARILTGWTVGTLANAASEPGKFFFAPARHEPGDHTVLGKRYPDRGQSTGIEVLRDLAAHRSTARHIAGKLARHFVSDDPPADLLQRLEATFFDTGGDLAAVSRALVNSPEAWDAPPAKVVPPYDFLVAIVRGFGLEPQPAEMMRLAFQLGQPLWRPPAPAGWPDGDIAWAAPSAMRERLRVAEVAARRVDPAADPRLLADAMLGGALGEATRLAVARAETREQALELLIMSPEFQRR